MFWHFLRSNIQLNSVNLKSQGKEKTVQISRGSNNWFSIKKHQIYGRRPLLTEHFAMFSLFFSEEHLTALIPKIFNNLLF